MLGNHRYPPFSSPSTSSCALADLIALCPMKRHREARESQVCKQMDLVAYSCSCSLELRDGAKPLPLSVPRFPHRSNLS